MIKRIPIGVFILVMILCGGIVFLAASNDESQHTHSFIDGKCENGAVDDDYKQDEVEQPVHKHNFIEGKCE